MRTITLVIQIGLTKLVAAEYLNLMSRVRTLIESVTPTALGITAEEFAEFTNLLEKLQLRVSYSSASALTAQLNELDKQRDSLLTYIFATINSGVNLPSAILGAAYKALELLIRPYVGIQTMPNQQQTMEVNGLIGALSADDAKAHLATVNLQSCVDDLKTINDEYASLTQQRTLDMGQDVPETTEALRKQIDPIYTSLAWIAFAENVSQPTEVTAQFIHDLNLVIKEVNNLYNQRTGKTTGTEDPVIPGTDPGTEDPAGGGDDEGGSPSGI